MKTITTFLVHLEGTFGYTRDPLNKRNIRLNVMAVDTLKGGDPLLLDKQILCAPDDCRVASRRDFNNFRVSVKGYAGNPEYHLVNEFTKEPSHDPMIFLLEYNDSQKLFHFNDYESEAFHHHPFTDGWRPITLIGEDLVNDAFLTFLDNLLRKGLTFPDIYEEVLLYLINQKRD